MEIQGKNKPEILSHLLDTLVKNDGLADRSGVLARLLEREKLKTTGIGSGVAIPHCKVADVDRARIAIGISREGLDYQSLDGHPTHLFFLVVAPKENGNAHLKICARIARLVREENFIQELLAMETPPEVVSLIRKKESVM